MSGGYQPIFIATAKGAAAEVMVRAQKPNLTTVSARAGEAKAAIAASAARIRFIDHL